MNTKILSPGAINLKVKSSADNRDNVAHYHDGTLNPLTQVYLNKQTLEDLKNWKPDTCNYCGKYCNADCPGCLEYIKDITELEKSTEYNSVQSDLQQI